MLPFPFLTLLSNVILNERVTEVPSIHPVTVTYSSKVNGLALKLLTGDKIFGLEVI